GVPIFNPLRDDLQPKFMREVDRRADHDLVGFVRGDGSYKHLVDLQLIDWQLLDVAQRRLPGSVIVDRQANAVLLKLAEHLEGGILRFEDRAFGNLDGQPARIHSRFGKYSEDFVGELRFSDVRRRGIDR